MEPPPNFVEPCPEDPTLATLMRSIADGDERAFETLYDRTSRQVYGLVLRITGNVATAEEVLLDAYTQAWRKRTQYDEVRGTPLAWLITIARTRAIDRLRSTRGSDERQAALDEASMHAEATNITAAMEARDAGRHVRSALEALPGEQREVIELAYYGGMSHSEIAARLGQPLGTVKTRVRLAMMKLREILRPTFEGAG